MREIKIVAFDFFDTLVHRTCHPEIILKYWALHMSAYMQCCVTERVLYQVRKNAAKITEKNTIKEEQSYEELIGCVYNEIKQLGYHFDDKAVFIQKSKELEFDIEIQHQYIDEGNVQLLKEYSKRGVKLILISDFYQGKDFFLRVLEYFQLQEYFTEIYVSSDIGKRKSTGALYQHIINELNCEPKEMLMLGNNNISDVTIPGKFFINAQHLPFADKNVYMSQKILCSNVDGMLKKREASFAGYIPALIVMMDNLYHEAIKLKCKKLLFCSREGQKLKVMFDVFQEKMYATSMIETSYFYVSRRATLLASLSDVQKEKFDRIFRQYNELKLEDFLYSVNFSSDEIDCLATAIQFDKNRIITTPKRCEYLNAILNNSIFIDKYNKKRREQKRCFIEYLHNLNGEDSDVFLVDIGWKGTIQDNIYEILDEKVDVTGFYFGVFDCQSSERNKKIGLLFDQRKIRYDYSIYVHNYIDLEKIFAADHGAVLSYKAEDGQIIPELSCEKSNLDIYKYVAGWQRDMIIDFSAILDLILHSNCFVCDIQYFLLELYLKQLCIVFPKQNDLYLNFRTKVKENFGNISKASLKAEHSVTRDKKMKQEYMYVDYTYRLLDRHNLQCLYPLSMLYGQAVLIVKRIQLKVCATYDRFIY